MWTPFRGCAEALPIESAPLKRTNLGALSRINGIGIEAPGPFAPNERGSNEQT